ncbi:hypothetical protein G9C98_000508 [Cotesia typhae]|uniref:ATP-dependent RNA helicase DDX49 n=1 Tax=Cotesia typhae TaxID=2053667 RepID=A0A8J5R7B9_9HYME|nr:hypothetical protein G9C98_000508 [Cotesia typhae]
MTQAQELSKRPHIVVATPGRLADHLESCDTFSLNKLKFVVLDEADRLLGGDFDEQIKTIFAALPKQRQSLLFSATMTDALEQVKQVARNNVFQFEDQDDSGMATVKQLDQRYVVCPRDVRDAYLVEVIRTFKGINPNGSIMIFTDTCKNCQLLSMTFNTVGFENVALHAMIKQRERLSALNKFKSNCVKILIATDVASRGLDIPLVELVINHTIPNVPKEYIHRVEKEIATIFTQVSTTKREAEIVLDETDFYEKKMINKRKKLIMEGKTDEEIDKILAPKKKHRKKDKKMKTIKTIENKLTDV